MGYWLQHVVILLLVSIYSTAGQTRTSPRLSNDEGTLINVFKAQSGNLYVGLAGSGQQQFLVKMNATSLNIEESIEVGSGIELMDSDDQILLTGSVSESEICIWDLQSTSK